MLRLIAVVLILGGAVAAIAWPLAMTRGSGETNLRETIFSPKIDEPAPQWRTTTIELAPVDSPVSLTLTAEYITENQTLRESMQYSVKLETAGTEILSDEIELVAQRSESPNTNNKIYSVVLPEFDVKQTAAYVVSLRPSSSAAQQLEKLGISIRSVEKAPDNRFVKPGFAALGLGVVLWLFTTGRRTKSARNRQERKSRKWGRS